MTTLFTIKHNEELKDWDFPTKEEAIAYADEWWNDLHECEGYSNGDMVEDDAEIVEFYYDENNEIQVRSYEPLPLIYECYHGDKAEHGVGGW